MQKPLLLTICAALLVLLGGCALIEKYAFVADATGNLQPDPEVVSAVDRAGDAAAALGVPFASIAGELTALLLAGVGLVLNQKRKAAQQQIASEQQVSSVLITAVEQADSGDLKAAITRKALSEGIEPLLHERVKSLTTTS